MKPVSWSRTHIVSDTLWSLLSLGNPNSLVTKTGVVIEFHFNSIHLILKSGQWTWRFLALRNRWQIVKLVLYVLNVSPDGSDNVMNALQFCLVLSPFQLVLYVDQVCNTSSFVLRDAVNGHPLLLWNVT